MSYRTLTHELIPVGSTVTVLTDLGAVPGTVISLDNLGISIALTDGVTFYPWPAVLSVAVANRGGAR